MNNTTKTVLIVGLIALSGFLLYNSAKAKTKGKDITPPPPPPPCPKCSDARCNAGTHPEQLGECGCHCVPDVIIPPPPPNGGGDIDIDPILPPPPHEEGSGGTDVFNQFNEAWNTKEAADWYYKNNQDVYDAGIDAWEHYKLFGFKEGRQWLYEIVPLDMGGDVISPPNPISDSMGGILGTI